MANGVYIALSGAQAELRKLDVISNNLANNNTPGFKRDRVNFREVLAKSMVDDSQQDRRFVEVAGTHTDMSPGSLEETGNPLDLAILGEGFLKIRTPRGERLIRGGTFLQGTDGTLMTSKGDALLGPDGSPVVLPPNGVSPVIDHAGNLLVNKEVVGSLALTEVKDISAIRKEEGGVYATDPANMQEAERSEVHQGYIEHSNGDAVRIMVSLVETQRHYDTLHRAIETYKDLDQKVTRIVS